MKISLDEAVVIAYRNWRVLLTPAKLGKLLAESGYALEDVEGAKALELSDFQAFLAANEAEHKLYKASEVVQWLHQQYNTTVVTSTLRRWMREGAENPRGKIVKLPSTPLPSNVGHRGLFLRDVKKFCAAVGENIGRGRGRPRGSRKVPEGV